MNNRNEAFILVVLLLDETRLLHFHVVFKTVNISRSDVNLFVQEDQTLEAITVLDIKVLGWLPALQF